MGTSMRMNMGRSLRRTELERDYAAAWAEWETSGDQAAWDHTADDGIADSDD
jgi:hypothetical protein